jgi:hypothetical protein
LTVHCFPLFTRLTIAEPPFFRNFPQVRSQIINLALVFKNESGSSIPLRPAVDYIAMLL